MTIGLGESYADCIFSDSLCSLVYLPTHSACRTRQKNNTDEFLQDYENFFIILFFRRPNKHYYEFLKVDDDYNTKFSIKRGKQD